MRTSRFPVYEVSIQPQARVRALLGVKLGREQIVPGDSRGKRRAVQGFAGRMRRIVRNAVITVHKIEKRFVGHAVPQRVPLRLTYAVPAHLRDLETRAIILQLAFQIEAHDLAGYQAKAIRTLRVTFLA